jgi:hypothetical protein
MKKMMFCSLAALAFIASICVSCEKEKDTPPTFEEMLTGGADATNGKTWVLSQIVDQSKDGGGSVNSSLILLLQIEDSILTKNGIGAEYDNEFTFYHDGKYVMNAKNGNFLAGMIYGYANQNMVGNPANLIGLCAAAYTPPATATWTLHTEDLVVDAITNPLEVNIPPVHGNVTFTGMNWLTFSEGAFFGILDFPTTAKVIVKDISQTEMHVAVFVCVYQKSLDPAGMEYMNLPTHLFHLTYLAK